jgi:hypothetical protein
MAAFLLLACSFTSFGQSCGVTYAPPSLQVQSFDVYDAFSGNYVASQFGSGTENAVTLPMCPQLYFGWADTGNPYGYLALIAVASPFNDATGNYISQYLFADVGNGRPLPPFYPFPAGGYLDVGGIDVRDGSYFETGVPITLVIFRIQ